MVGHPAGGADEPPGEQVDVEAQVTAPGIDRLLAFGEEIHEQRGQTRLLEHGRHRPVAGAVAAAAAAVGEHDDTRRLGRDREVAGQDGVAGVEANPLPDGGDPMPPVHETVSTRRG